MTDYATAKRLLDTIRALVGEQAEDAGLWMPSDDVVVSYIQQELRKLHAVIEQEHE